MSWYYKMILLYVPFFLSQNRVMYKRKKNKNWIVYWVFIYYTNLNYEDLHDSVIVQPSSGGKGHYYYLNFLQGYSLLEKSN